MLRLLAIAAALAVFTAPVMAMESNKPMTPAVKVEATTAAAEKIAGKPTLKASTKTDEKDGEHDDEHDGDHKDGDHK
jgi:hypothetical protein